MVIPASQFPDNMQRQWIERAVRNAVTAARALDEDTVEIVELAVRIGQYWGPAERALFFSSIAQVFTDADCHQEGLDLLLLALETARPEGRDIVFEVLANGASTLAAVDGGEMLMRIADQLEAVDSWFGE